MYHATPTWGKQNLDLALVIGRGLVFNFEEWLDPSVAILL